MGFGYLWVVQSHSGIVTKIDPVHRRVVARIDTALPVDSITAGAGAVWVTAANGINATVRIDPITGDWTRTPSGPSLSAVLAAGDGAVWRLGTQDAKSRLDRLDPVSGRTIATIPTHTAGDAIAIGGSSLWTLDAGGVLTQRDPATGRALRRLSGLGRSLGLGEKVLTADATGVWAVRPGALIRVATGGSVVRRVPLPADALTVFSEDSGDLWLARGAAGLRSQLLRVDRRTGKLTGSLDLGSHQPQALVPSPRGLWVVCADGTALLVR
jgi:streptogramin lyase